MYTINRMLAEWTVSYKGQSASGMTLSTPSYVIYVQCVDADGVLGAVKPLTVEIIDNEAPTCDFVTGKEILYKYMK